MDAVQILRDIRVREANMLKLIALVSRKDKSVASAFFNYSFDVQERLRTFSESMGVNLIDAFFENTCTVFKMTRPLSCIENENKSSKKAKFPDNVSDLTPQGKFIHELRSEERKILLLMRELAVTSPDTMKNCCCLNEQEIRRFREISVDELLELSFMQRQGTIFRLKFDTKKLIEEFFAWLNEPIAVGLILDKAV